MAKVFYKSAIPNNKPLWLLKVQYAVREATDIMILRGDIRDFENLKSFIDAAIRAEREQGTLQRSEVVTEIRADEGRTVLFIKRNGMLLQTYYIE